MSIAIAAIGLVLIACIFGWALFRKHPEDAEREAFDRAAEDRANTDGFAQPSTAKIELDSWGNIIAKHGRKDGLE